MLKGEFDALVMAAAGIERLNLNHHITEYFNHKKFLNAPGQGAIAVEHSKNNNRIKEIVKKINHSKSGKDCIKDMVSTKNFTDNLSQELSEKFIKKDVVQIINKIDSEIRK